MIETKQMLSSERTIIEQYKAFGWEETGEEAGTSKEKVKKVNLARDTEMKHYKELKVLENTFEGHMGKVKPEPQLDYFFAVLLYLLLILPGVIYVSSFRKRKAKTLENNEKEREYMKQACVQAKKIRG